MTTRAGFLALLVVALGVGDACAKGDAEFCRSPDFRKMFLEGQQGIIIDDARPSPSLTAQGARVLPCLETIAEQGGSALGIEGCAEASCKSWALWSLRLIGSPDARAYLVGFLGKDATPDLLITDIQALASLREMTARPSLLRLLQHTSAEVRLRSVVALGVLGNREDFVPMLDAVKGLPVDMVAEAVHGFRALGDDRAIPALRGMQSSMRDASARTQLDGELTAWENAAGEDSNRLTTLRSGSGWDLIRAIRDVPTPATAETRDALLALLRHEDPHVRAESVAALGKMRQAGDFDQLLQATLALPEPYLPIAAQGLERLGDPRAVAPLEQRAGDMKNGTRKQDVLAITDRLRKAAQVQEPATVATPE